MDRQNNKLKKMPKSSQYEVIQRVKLIGEMLIEGNSRDYIVQYSSANWQLGERQTDKYLSRARETIGQSVKREISYDYAKAVRRYEQLYKLSMDKGDYRTALTVNKELTTLQGVLKSQMEHSGEIKFICSVPD